MPHALHYTGQPLDRADHLREDDIRALLSGDSVRVLPMWRGRHAVGSDLMPLWRSRVETIGTHFPRPRCRRSNLGGGGFLEPAAGYGG